jgi:D-glycero-alpha-D-manno-heptose-7-phosphate kinase
MSIKVEGSVRVDLLGGTLDITPINYVLPNVVTLNLATSLKAVVEIEETQDEGVLIVSKDYHSETFFKESDFNEDSLRGETFGPLSFVAQILSHLNLTTQAKVTLQSGSPPGAGLGGSSAMGVTLYQAICKYKSISFDRDQAIKEVNTIEARILNCGPAGYQDYYPAVYGGVLALKPIVGGIEVEQLFSQELQAFLEDHLTLVYSGQTRLSGINNWEVYKKFFDNDSQTRRGMREICDLSFKAYSALKSSDFSSLIDLIGQEGELRKGLFPNIQTPEMNQLHEGLLKLQPSIKLKVCGAGGGGCFLICHPKELKDSVNKLVEAHQMTKLLFSIEEPL